MLLPVIGTNVSCFREVSKLMPDGNALIATNSKLLRSNPLNTEVAVREIGAPSICTLST